jgi:site-specific DNA-adenine methylase
MFSYYGSKSKIVDYYPPPKHKRIIETFAGSARYSLKYWQNDVLLVDKYEVVVKLWKWLQTCTEKDILNMPKLKKGDDIRLLNVSEEEKILLGFFAQAAQGKPTNMVSSMGEQNMKKAYTNIAKQLHKIKHWEIKQGCYTDLENETATWFIDPPYQYGGQHQYKFGNKQIDFAVLSEWCKSRDGQVIVCENTKADWLPFKPVVKIDGANHTGTTEAIWSNIPTNYDNEQILLQF